MRDLLAWKLGYHHGDREPVLASGWRAAVVGPIVDDLLSGRAALRIGDLNSHDPLVIERFDGPRGAAAKPDRPSPRPQEES
jgi:hypothetical protein